MQVIIVKDGTVPIALAKVVETDGPEGSRLPEYLSLWETQGGMTHDVFEVFEVPDDSRFVFVGWTEDEGFNVIGFKNLERALDVLNEDATPDEVANSNINGRHWALTYGRDTEWESYGHVFTLLS